MSHPDYDDEIEAAYEAQENSTVKKPNEALTHSNSEEWIDELFGGKTLKESLRNIVASNNTGYDYEQLKDEIKNGEDLLEEGEVMNKLDKIIRDINEDGYADGEIGAGHPASIEDWKNAVKELFLELIGEDIPTVKLVDPMDFGSEEHHDSGYNGAKAELRKEVEKL